MALGYESGSCSPHELVSLILIAVGKTDKTRIAYVVCSEKQEIPRLLGL